MKNTKRNLGIVLGISILFIMVIGITYATFNYTKKGTKENSVTTSSISFRYKETNDGITLTDALPMQDSEGKVMNKGTGEGKGYFDFEVATDYMYDSEIQYYVYAVDTTGEDVNKLSNRSI